MQKGNGEKGSGFNLLSAAIGVLQSEAVFWVEWPSSVGQPGPGRAYHGLTCRALHSSCPPCSVQRRNSLSLSTIRPRVVTACASPSLSPSFSLYMTRGDANSSVQFAVLSILASYKVVEIAVANPQLVGKERKPRRKWIGRLQTSP